MLRQISLVAVATVSLLGTSSAQPSDTALPQRFTAFAVTTGGPRSAGGATQVELTISRWSTDEEARRLITVLKDKGAERMLEVLRELEPVGSIQTPGNLAYDLHFAQQEPTGDGGRRIVLATDRPIPVWEAVNRPRTLDYPFTFIELRLNGRGEGEGKLALATRIDVSSNGRLIELVNYTAQPINLNQVKRVGR